MSDPNQGEKDDVRGYVAGYALALALTCAAFAVVRWPSFNRITTLAIVFTLGFAQAIVHFRYFLHITLAKSARDDLWLILFSVLIIVLMVSGSLVILMNLRARMM
ncbi:MAG: cytochrome C oxidase subunit IV family protein [Beijerinckiaceae bacterium]|nr:cytochrome C oxidase subunit IV family protein [Beijerinckiaceae bacterium]